MREHVDFGCLRQHAAIQCQLRLPDLLHRIMLVGKGRKQLGLSRDVVMHRDNDGRLHLIDDLHYVFKSQVSHGIDGNHHHIDVLQNFDLFLRQQVTDVA